MAETFIIKIRQAAEKRVLFLPHTVAQMTHQQRMITASEIRNVINHGEIIEEYPEDYFYFSVEFSFCFFDPICCGTNKPLAALSSNSLSLILYWKSLLISPFIYDFNNSIRK